MLLTRTTVHIRAGLVARARAIERRLHAFRAFDLDAGAYGLTRLCCTNPVRDSSRESSVVAVRYEQTHTPRLQDQELARL